MQGKLKNIWNQGGAAAGWAKVMGMVAAVVVAGVLTYNKVGTQEVQIEAQGKAIYVLQTNDVKQDMEIGSLKTRADKSDVVYEKLIEAINNLTIAVVKMEAKLDSNSKQN